MIKYHTVIGRYGRHTASAVLSNCTDVFIRKAVYKQNNERVDKLAERCLTGNIGPRMSTKSMCSTQVNTLINTGDKLWQKMEAEIWL